MLDFIELRPFTRQWAELGLNDEKDLFTLQMLIIADPKKGVTVPGTGGIRKIRFAKSDGHKGKSGGFRVLYVYFEEFGVVLLCVVYGKGEIEEISMAVKARLKSIVSEIEIELKNNTTG